MAIAAPTPISALVHSSTLVTAGVYLILRLNIVKLRREIIIFNVLLLCVFTIIISRFCAFYEIDIKKIIAFSTISQLRLIFIIIVVGNELIGFFHVLTHALFKSLLFLCSGIFIHENFNNQDIRKFGLLLRMNPFRSGLFIIRNISLAGFPYMRGFYSKDLILEFIYTINLNIFLLIVFLVSIIFTTIYSFRISYVRLIIGKNMVINNYLMRWD